MDFNHTETRVMLADSLNRFLADRYGTEQRIKIIGSAHGISEDIWQQLAELGILGALFTEEEGGFGGNGFDIALVFEALGRALVVEPVLQSAILCGRLLVALGNEEQKSLIEQVIGGQIRLALAIGEEGNHYDLDSARCEAVKVEDGFQLSGQKSVVMHGGSADYLIVSCKLESGALALFLVPRASDGLTLRSYPTIDGNQASEVMLQSVSLPQSALLGEGEAAFEALEEAQAYGLVALCAEALGAMESAKDLTVDYLKTRKQFGRELGKFQVLQHRMAQMLVELEQARSAVINAAGNLHQPYLQRELNVSAAKNVIGRVAKLVGEECIQMHGGIGLTDEYALSHYAKRMSMIDHQLGDVDYHLERFIALSAKREPDHV